MQQPIAETELWTTKMLYGFKKPESTQSFEEKFPGVWIRKKKKRDMSRSASATSIDSWVSEPTSEEGNADPRLTPPASPLSREADSPTIAPRPGQPSDSRTSPTSGSQKPSLFMSLLPSSSGTTSTTSASSSSSSSSSTQAITNTATTTSTATRSSAAGPATSFSALLASTTDVSNRAILTSPPPPPPFLFSSHPVKDPSAAIPSPAASVCSDEHAEHIAEALSPNTTAAISNLLLPTSPCALPTSAPMPPPAAGVRTNNAPQQNPQLKFQATAAAASSSTPPFKFSDLFQAYVNSTGPTPPNNQPGPPQQQPQQQKGRGGRGRGGGSKGLEPNPQLNEEMQQFLLQQYSEAAQVHGAAFASQLPYHAAMQAAAAAAGSGLLEPPLPTRPTQSPQPQEFYPPGPFYRNDQHSAPPGGPPPFPNPAAFMHHHHHHHHHHHMPKPFGGGMGGGQFPHQHQPHNQQQQHHQHYLQAIQQNQLFHHLQNIYSSQNKSGDATQGSPLRGGGAAKPKPKGAMGQPSGGMEVGSAPGQEGQPVDSNNLITTADGQTREMTEEERIAAEKAAVDPRKYKTKMCRNWELTGHCPYEHTCCFAHGPDELRDITSNHKLLASIGYFSNVILLAMTNGTKPALPPHCLYQQPALFKTPETSEQLHACTEVLPTGVNFPFQQPLAAAFKGFRKEKQKRKQQQQQQGAPGTPGAPSGDPTTSDGVNPGTNPEGAADGTNAPMSKARKRRNRRNKKAQELAAAAAAANGGIAPSGEGGSGETSAQNDDGGGSDDDGGADGADE